ncbi:hypothetical protein BFF78_08545 [Streptomyces fodineus]|uniref:Uncharacterized protein n=1 Tax=Streptomyces fodineus TaxID=1904616 RepID=A0A1D7Y6D5_9ACTN|nr:hypothetical protein [Streptomyces fodineus]AOR31084.1 hypothetical protein BFF78_08545 [Streptomyces fodineus]
MTPSVRPAPPPLVRTVRMRLHRIGTLTWPALRALLTEDSAYTGARCAWTDLNGFRLEPATALPAEPPVATHLWAWTSQTALRSRIDTGRALTCALLPDTGATGESVPVRIRPAIAWPGDDHQVGRPDRPLAASSIELLELTGAAPVTFVRETPADRPPYPAPPARSS